MNSSLQGHNSIITYILRKSPNPIINHNLTFTRATAPQPSHHSGNPTLLKSRLPQRVLTPTWRILSMAGPRCGKPSMRETTAPAKPSRQTHHWPSTPAAYSAKQSCSSLLLLALHEYANSYSLKTQPYPPRHFWKHSFSIMCPRIKLRTMKLLLNYIPPHLLWLPPLTQTL